MVGFWLFGLSNKKSSCIFVLDKIKVFHFSYYTIKQFSNLTADVTFLVISGSERSSGRAC